MNTSLTRKKFLFGAGALGVSQARAGGCVSAWKGGVAM